MKKLLAITLALLVTAALFAACGKTDDSEAASGASSENGSAAGNDQEQSSADASSDESSESNAPDDPADDGLKAPVSDAPIDVKNGITENMLIRSVHSEGDNSRLAEKLRKAKSGEALNVVFLGDSITAGSSADNKHRYTTIVTDWWKENVSADTKFHNAGIGATDSYYAVHRADRDVFAHDPDVIFIEFINDSGKDEYYKQTMESLIRKCLSAENAPAVVLIEMTLKGGGNAQGSHVPVAEKYGVPVLSYHDAVAPEVEAGSFSFDDISPDGTHPNNIGHSWVGEIVTHYLDSVLAKADSIAEPAPFDTSTAPLTNNGYERATIIDNTDSSVVTDPGSFTEGATPYPFKNGWRTTEGGSITFEMEFQNLGMCYYKSTDGKTGTVTVSVDGEQVGMVNGNFPNGWGSYGASAEVYTSDTRAKHTVTVTLLEGDRQNFEILEWLVS